MSTKQIQGALWSTAPKNWAKYFEPFFTPMYKKGIGAIITYGRNNVAGRGLRFRSVQLHGD
jgi:hypothetical protein